MKKLVIIKGGGDLATGIAHRFFRSGFDVLITEIAQPTVIRRSVAFANAIFEGKMVVEGVTAVHAQPAEALHCLQNRVIPVIVDPTCRIARSISPWGIVDAILAKKNTGTTIDDAAVVVGIGPGFAAGKDVHFVVESLRGHDLGRVIVSGAAQPDTGIPGDIGGYTGMRLVKAPCAGKFVPIKRIGDLVTAGEVLGHVEGSEVVASISGVLRGLLHEGLQVTQNMKIGDIDPRAKVEHCWTISDKARAIGGGVLEAMLMAESCFPLPTFSGGNSPKGRTVPE